MDLAGSLVTCTDVPSMFILCKSHYPVQNSMKGMNMMYQNSPYVTHFILVGFVQICFMLIHEQGLKIFMLVHQRGKYLPHQLKITEPQGPIEGMNIQK